MNLSRRTFMAAAGGALVAGGCATRPRGAVAARAKAPFRVLYSNDTTNITSCVSPWHKAGEPFRPAMLEATVDEVFARVDAHFLQPGLGWIPWWKSRVYPADEHYRWFTKRTGLEPDSYGRYMLDGGDLVGVFVARCRLRRQAPFVSLRMNDAHHLEYAGTKDRRAIWASRFYVEHPAWRIGPDPKKHDQRVLNWAVPEVRAQKLAFLRELCEGYDLDGVELDFMRWCSLFPAATTTSAQRRAIVTGFVRDVRALLDRTARGGRRRWLCARLPCVAAAHDPMGIDLPSLVAAGLDMANLSHSYFTVQQGEFAALRRAAAGASVYLELCHSTWNGKRLGGGYDNFLFRRTTAEQYATAAHLAYARGGDGVSLFNFVYTREHGGPGRGPFAEPPFDVLRLLADRDALARRQQHWFLGPGWAHPFSKERLLPRAVRPGDAAEFTLDLAPPAGGWKAGGKLRIQGEQALGDGRWTARLNDADLAAAADVSEPYPNPYPPMLGRPEELRAWTVPAAALRDGPNRLQFTLAAGPAASLAFIDLAVG